MEDKVIEAKWIDHFEKRAAEHPELAPEKIGDLKNDASVEIVLLDLEDLAPAEFEQRAKNIVDSVWREINPDSAVASISANEGAKPKVTPAPASFPVTDISLLPIVSDPLERYQTMMEELLGHGDYHRIRNEFCALSIILNTQGLLAPAFRPRLNTKRKHGDPVFKEIHRDQIVIDCHWLHSTKQLVTMRDQDAEFQPMFRKRGTFPFDLAWDFAGNNWTKNHRVSDMLRLTPFQQCQMATLRDNDVSAKIKSVDHGTRKDGKSIPAPISIFVRGLNAWCERDRRIHNHRDGYIAVWRARSYLGPKESVRQVGALAALMLGESPKDDKTIRDREEKIVRHILGE